VDAHRRQQVADHAQEERDDYQSNSLCNSCKYGFRVASRREWGDKESTLNIWCTGPWFEHGYEMHGVTACNGYVAGEFAPMSGMVDAISKALNVDPYDGMTDEQKAIHLDQQLGDLEAESERIQKAMDGEDDGGEDAEPGDGDDVPDGDKEA